MATLTDARFILVRKMLAIGNTVPSGTTRRGITDQILIISKLVRINPSILDESPT